MKHLKFKVGLWKGFVFPLLFFSAGFLIASYIRETSHLHVEAFPVLKYKDFSLSYDGRHRIPLYTYECIKASNLEKKASRSHLNFVEDPNIYRLHRSALRDYKGSGYDRGHMVAAADLSYSQESMAESFFLSNICPQCPELNRNIWAKLEKYTRDLALEYGEVEVLTGPLFLPENIEGENWVRYKLIGKSEVAVPTHFFKLIAYKDPKQTVLAYVLPNDADKLRSDFEEYRVSIERLETVSGLRLSIK